MRVNKEHIWLWVEALRSDRFKGKQGHRALFRGEGDRSLNPVDYRPGSPAAKMFCCLGVGCVVAHEHGLVNTAGYQGTLPPPVRDWFGLYEADPIVIDERGQERRLTAMNDLSFFSFEEIADAIERTYLGTNNEGEEDE